MPILKLNNNFDFTITKIDDGKYHIRHKMQGHPDNAILYLKYSQQGSESSLIFKYHSIEDLISNTTLFQAYETDFSGKLLPVTRVLVPVNPFPTEGMLLRYPFPTGLSEEEIVIEVQFSELTNINDEGILWVGIIDNKAVLKVVWQENGEYNNG